MPHRRLKRLAGHALEAGVAVGLILTLFVGLQGILNIVLPSDSGLGGLLGGMRAWDNAGASISPDRSLHSDGIGSERPVAVLTSFHSKVKTRPGTSVVWRDARRGMKLRNQDAFQNMYRSSASITFPGHGRLKLGSNTHIIIRSNDSDIFSTEKRSSLVMIDGELRGRLVSGNGERMQLEVTLPHGSTEIAASEGSGEAAFRIRVNDDSTVVVAVDEGSALVVVQGDTVTVRSSQYTTIDSSTRPSPPRAQPDPIRIVGPESGKVYDFRDLSPSVDFEWIPDPSFSGYRLLIARDIGFTDVVYDEVVTGSRVTHGNLESGTHYWRVLGLVDGFEVTIEDTRVIHLTQSADPPSLKVWFPDGIVESSVFVLKGRTKPGTKILVGGIEAKVDARGFFMHRLQLNPGLNVVVVEAVDRRGNVAYESKVINSKP